MKDREFNLIIQIYKKALEQVLEDLKEIRNNYEEFNNIISSISSRIKTKESIINKMKRKNYKLNYKNIINNINDIAGIRIICPLKSNIYTIINIIEQMPNVKILNKKDYIAKPKESGYSGYHLIIETPVDIEGKQIPIKIEIQLRTMAMDFWATNEHKMKYKTEKKLSWIDSKRLVIYAKLLSIIDNRLMKINKKQTLNKFEY